VVKHNVMGGFSFAQRQAPTVEHINPHSVRYPFGDKALNNDNIPLEMD
jgi:hypothetical protein